MSLPSNSAGVDEDESTRTATVASSSSGVLDDMLRDRSSRSLESLQIKPSGIPLSVSLTLSLSPSLFPACIRMPSPYSRARASTALPKRVSSEVKHNERSWTIGDISADTKEKKQQRGQMFAQQTSLQVFPLAFRLGTRCGVLGRR